MNNKQIVALDALKTRLAQRRKQYEVMFKKTTALITKGEKAKQKLHDYANDTATIKALAMRHAKRKFGLDIITLTEKLDENPNEQYPDPEPESSDSSNRS